MPNIVEDLFAFIELQVSRPLFTSLVRTGCSLTPNPIITMSFAPTELVHQVSFNPTGETIVGAPSPGQLTLSFPVTITSITLQGFEQGNALAWHTYNANYIVNVRMDGSTAVATLVRIDVGTEQHPASEILFSQDFASELASLGASVIPGGAVLYDANNDNVVLRLATSATSLSTAAVMPPIDRIHNPVDLNSRWSVFLSGGALANILTTSLNAQLASSLPPGVVVSSPPEVDWAVHGDGATGLDVSFELDAVNACPSVLGDSDIHVTIHIFVTFAPDVPHQAIGVTAHVSHDTSAWDTFVCAIKSVVALTATPFFFIGGLDLAVAAAIAVPSLVYSTVDDHTSSQKIKGFTKLSNTSPGDDETLATSEPIPTLYPNNKVPPNERIQCTVGQDGITVRGTWIIDPPPASHAIQVSGNPVQSSWSSSWTCKTLPDYDNEFEIAPVVVSDLVTIPLVGQQPSEIELFNVYPVDPSKWTAAFNFGVVAAKQIIFVTPIGDPAANPGLGGKVFIHSSAGLAAVDINPLPPAPPKELTGQALQTATIYCATQQHAHDESGQPWAGSGIFDLHWLVDPAPWESAAGVLHEWSISVDAFAADTSVELQIVSGSVTNSRTFAGRNQPMMVPLVAKAGDQLRLAVHGPATLNGSVGQRLLVITGTIAAGAPIVAISRTSGDNFAVLTAKQVLTISTARGILAAADNPGASGLTHTPNGTYVWGPGGAFLLSRLGLLPVASAAINGVQVDPQQTVFQTAGGPIAVRGLRQLRVTLPQIPATGNASFGSIFLRPNGREVLYADGSNLVVTRPGRFRIGASSAAAPIALSAIARSIALPK
jgi:hypothetical protein